VRHDRLITTITVREMTEDDFASVVRWLRDPGVERWWHDPLDLDAVRAKYRPRLLGDEPTRMLVVEHEGIPIGLAQWYRWDDYAEDRDNYRIDPGALGMDYAIGAEGQRGRGIGTAVVGCVLDLMRAAHPPGTRVTVTPEAANLASCRVLAKNGFTVDAVVRSARLPGRAPEGPTAVHSRSL
jgi:aminoglycoside 6'-N-acetyltransferase